MHEWGLAPTSNCKCSAAEQTADHVILTCPTNRLPKAIYGLAVWDDNTLFCIVFSIYPPDSQESDEGAIHRAAITPTCFRRYRDIAVRLIFFFFNRHTYVCNLVLLVELPSRGNYRKVPFPRAQQHDHGWIRTQTISIKDRARNR